MYVWYARMICIYGMWYFGELTQLCSYDLCLNIFQVLSVQKGAQHDRIASTYVWHFIILGLYFDNYFSAMTYLRFLKYMADGLVDYKQKIYLVFFGCCRAFYN